jgi:hypothetical protein
MLRNRKLEKFRWALKVISQVICQGGFIVSVGTTGSTGVNEELGFRLLNKLKPIKWKQNKHDGCSSKSSK